MQVLTFKSGVFNKLLIGSYETLRKHSADLAGSAELLVCDEVGTGTVGSSEHNSSIDSCPFTPRVPWATGLVVLSGNRKPFVLFFICRATV